MTSNDLSDITRGLQEAAAATNTLIAQQYIKLFDQFFDYNPHALGTPMKAKMVEVALGEQHTLQVPLIALVNPRGLALERMQVDLSVRINGIDTRAALEQARTDAPGARFQVTVGSNGRRGDNRDPDEVQIRMQFQASEPPEAINRLIEEYTNLILPQRTATAPNTPPNGERNEFIDAATVR
ncbi:DUF2589 domain-containing protein [Pseudomonas entomophila]|uniref:DUF2589 domain-containing protein n=1 Tax=Pseudomonas entomophila TaxID=312306 RepID=UPI0023D83842|nr:DUF2589 domain-containing protein [Pseudomonas entomophila]MDF0731999.1 DUF2589 domain-containing protein [Pseudomonas entomophila]